MKKMDEKSTNKIKNPFIVEQIRAYTYGQEIRKQPVNRRAMSLC